MSDGAGKVPAPPPVSVVICAYTAARWQDTRDAVDSVLRQSQPPLETLLVVDHNQELHDAFATEYARNAAVRVLPNSGPRGLSAGRNTGIAASRGEVVAFLDDDAVAEREWLRRL
ncbi:glycosyltransferase family 2 protein, partial [Streptomyces xiaopingdaonensis]|uniref:glycosyltransferase family 2 protein n=1 Tax=Streptomyces xiaopingdaonensis TaxID=1565415 RepID=UPI00052569BE